MTSFSFLRASLLSAVFATAFAVVPTQASAGDCPADQMREGAMMSGATEPSGVTDDVLSAIDLGEAGDAMHDRMFRLRRLVVQPGGVVPWHMHDARPANIYIVEGSITEYRSSCAVPIEHTAGQSVAEHGHLAHWWKNNTDRPVVLISADILTTEKMGDHTM